MSREFSWIAPAILASHARLTVVEPQLHFCAAGGAHKGISLPIGAVSVSSHPDESRS